MSCTVSDIVTLLEELAPPRLAEDWDNAGLQLGSALARINAVLVSLDVSPVVREGARPPRGRG